MRFKIRGRLAPLGNAVIVKTDAEDEFEAIANVGRILKSEGHDLSKISKLAARRLDAAKSSSVYVGAVPTRKRKTATATAATTAPAVLPAIDGPSPSNPAVKAEDKAPTAPAAPAAPAATPQGKGKAAALAAAK